MPPATGEELLAVYKPFKGERPLWDFPGGLFRREVGAYVLSEALGWGLVPETVERPEGPFGPGSVQRFVHEDGTSHYFTLRDEPKWHPVLMRLGAFDVVANNADRKSGHVLLAEDRLWAIDNGLCFNSRGQAAHGDLGLRRRRRSTPASRRIWPDWPTTGRRPRSATCSSRPSWPPPWTGWTGSSACAPCPSWSTTGSGRPTPGRWSEPARWTGRTRGQGRRPE